MAESRKKLKTSNLFSSFIVSSNQKRSALLASTGAAYGLASPRSGIFFRGFFAFPRVSGRFGCLQFFSSRGGPQTQNYPRTPANRKYLRVDHLTGLENFSISERK